MKIIKSFYIVIVGLCATTLLQAQDITTKTAKPVESSIPPPGNKPITAPDLKPETKIITKGMTVDAIPETPSPLNRDEKQKSGGELKPTDTRNLPSSAVNVKPKEDDMKPKIVPVKDLSAQNSPSTLDINIPNTVLPKPIMTNMTSTISTTAPVIKDSKKSTPVITEQQKQN